MKPRILRSVISTLALALCGLVLGAPAPVQAQQGEDPNTVFQSDLFEDMEYRMIGPYRGGRATAEHGFPNKPDTYLIGTTGGGIWKTNDAGHHWVNISDGHFGGSIGEVTVAPSDPSVIYVGTGSACIRGNTSRGTGVYKSENGGESWEFIGLPESGQIGRIEVHPKNPDVAYVAALGSPFGKNEQRGVFKTTDGGETWENVLFVNDSTGVVDLAMNPEEPNEVFAGAWAAEREPWTLQSGTTWNEGGGLYRTTDGGENWTHLEEGLPSGDEMIGKTAITVSPADTDRVWAMVSAMEPHGGVYRSDDGGDSWTRTNRERKLRQREFYYTHIFAHPTDPNTVYGLNTGMYRSVDGGKTFESIDVPHGDVHGLWINPKKPSHMVVTDDGGGQVTTNAGETWSTYHNQPTVEFYRVEVDNHRPYNVYGPQQDNSTLRIPSIRSQGEHYAQEWRTVGGGESGHIAIQSYGPDIVWAGSYGGVITRKDMSTGHSPNMVAYPQVAVGDAPKDFKYRFQWNAPIAINPFDSTQVYHASQKLLRTDDGGMSWEEISPDLTYDDTTKQGPADGRVMKDRSGVEIYNTIFAVNPSEHEEGVIWVGTDDGRVWLTRDGGGMGNWTEITPSGLPQWSTVNMIEVSPHDAGTAYIAVYRYRQDDFAPYIYRTDDYGESWTRIADGTRGIDAEHPTRVVREDPEREGMLYAGSEYGMYVSFDDGAHWQELQMNLPETPITDLQVHRNDLVVATQGRSFWILDNLSPLRQVNDRVAQSDAHFYEPQDAIRWIEIASPGNGSTGPNQEPELPPYGAVFDYYLAEDASDDSPVRLEVVDDEGNVVVEYSSANEEAGGGFFSTAAERSMPGEAGHHRITWEMQYPGVTERPDDVRLWGSTGGFPAPPGSYSARMIVDGDTTTHSFSVRKDPNLESVTNQELETKAQFARTIRDTLNSLFAHLNQVRDVRDQVESTAGYASKAGAPESIQETADELVARLDSLERRLIQPDNESFQDAINYPPKLDSQIAAVYGIVAGNMAPPTEGARQRFQDLLPQWADLRSDVRQFMQQEVSSYNDQLEQAGMSGVIVPQP
ncbi:MAG: hypothetical protein Q8W44_05870 [Candidatus Palauibacterales bacterium]|nr:hypothetical protein [Candidatus Palauibacterales bacterium]